MIASAIQRIAQETPNAVAVSHLGRQTTYAELHDRSLRLTDGLRKFTGQRVGVVVEDFTRQLTCLLALDRLGAEAFLYLASEVEAAAAARRDLNLAVVLSDLPEWNDRLIDAELGAGELPVAPGAKDGNVVLFTSGTSGAPKPVVHSWTSLARAVQTADRYVRRRWLLTYNPSGFAALQVMLQSLLTGGRLVVPASRTPADVSRVLVEEQVEFAGGTPTFWRLLLCGASPDELRNWAPQQITLGGEAAGQDVLDALHARFPGARLTHIYASTEMGTCFAVHDGEAGFPSSYLSDTDLPCELRIDESGELLIRSRRAMSGYLNEPWNPDGWFATGDLVRRSADRCRFVGRKSDCIHVGGAKVFPLEVESVIRNVPGVIEVIVKARRSSIVGELVSAEVVLREGVDQAVARRNIASECRQKLAPYKSPAIVEFKDSIRVTVNNKVSRRAD